MNDIEKIIKKYQINKNDLIEKIINSINENEIYKKLIIDKDKYPKIHSKYGFLFNYYHNMLSMINNSSSIIRLDDSGRYYFKKDSIICVDKDISNNIFTLSNFLINQNHVYSSSIGWLIFSDLIEENLGKNINLYIKECFLCGKDISKEIENYYLNVFKSNEIILIREYNDMTRRKVIYRKGIIEKFYLNTNDFYIYAIRFKNSETKKSTDILGYTNKYYMAFSEDSLKELVESLRKENLHRIFSEIESTEKKIESCSKQINKYKEKLDKLQEELLFEEEKFNDAFGI